MLQLSAEGEENHEAARVHRLARWCGWRVDLRRCVCRAEVADSSDWTPQLFPFPDCKSLPQEPPCLIAPELRALGWREGENLQIEIRSSQDDPAGLPRWAAELVSLRPDVLIGFGSSEAKALQAATIFRSSFWHRPIPLAMVL